MIMKMKPETVAVTVHEGGEWIAFSDFVNGNYDANGSYDSDRVHSIKFADGSVWDAVNGWRRDDLRWSPPGSVALRDDWFHWVTFPKNAAKKPYKANAADAWLEFPACL